MLKELPISLLASAQKIMETQGVLESCPSCGMVVGSCWHTEGQDRLLEDALSKENKPDDDEPELELSGEKEDILINPPYKTFTDRKRS